MLHDYQKTTNKEIAKFYKEKAYWSIIIVYK